MKFNGDAKVFLGNSKIPADPRKRTKNHGYLTISFYVNIPDEALGKADVVDILRLVATDIEESFEDLQEESETLSETPSGTLISPFFPTTSSFLNLKYIEHITTQVGR